MFEYLYIFDGMVTHLTPPVTPTWVKITAAETLMMVQQECFDVMDKDIADYKSWMKINLERAVKYDKHITTLNIQDWSWRSLPAYLQFVSFNFL